MFITGTVVEDRLFFIFPSCFPACIWEHGVLNLPSLRRWAPILYKIWHSLLNRISLLIGDRFAHVEQLAVLFLTLCFFSCVPEREESI